MAENPKTPLSDAAISARAEALLLTARETVEQLQSGSPRGAFKEYARESSGHRNGSSGDKLRRTDTTVFASGAPGFFRTPFADSSRPVHLVIDGSESMKFGSGDRSKFQYAQDLAAGLAYGLVRGGETVQISFFNEKIRASIPPLDSLDGFLGLMKKMAAWEPAGSTRIGDSILEFSETLGSEGGVILLSDFFEEDESWVKAVELLRFQGRPVLLLHVMDPAEIHFPFEDRVEFEGMEDAESLLVQADEVKAAYLDEIKKFFGKLHELSARCGSQYLLAETTKPPALILEAAFLLKRPACIA